jgi:hypothetical protein
VKGQGGASLAEEQPASGVANARQAAFITALAALTQAYSRET